MRSFQSAKAIAQQGVQAGATHMKQAVHFLAKATAFCALVALHAPAKADVLITSFEDDYFENALYASWVAPETVIAYGPESYSVTATGYGSNWTYIGGLAIQGDGNTHVKLDVTLEGPPAADAHLGPIITLVDADGTRNNYAWFGQLLGNNILTLPVGSPTWTEAPGTTPGLNLNAIDHLHLQLDPGGFGTTGQYTVRWNELSLITVAGLPGDFSDDARVDGEDFLYWQRGDSPTPLSAGDLTDWRTNYGDVALAPAVGAVPEPGGLGLLVLASVGVCGLRRMQRPMA
jgi:hypothetical protein